MNTPFPLGSPQKQALERLTALLHKYSPLALAFSGGLDSRFLAHAAALRAAQGVRLHLLHVIGPHMPEEESREAVLWAAARGLPLSLVPADPLGLTEVRMNSQQRCYHCKKELFLRLGEAAEKLPGYTKGSLCDGTNADDLGAYRPGLRALQEQGVRSPLAEAGLGKEMLRSIGAATGLERPEQTARPCLLTRFAYNVPASPAALAALALTEQNIAELLHAVASTLPLTERGIAVQEYSPARAREATFGGGTAPGGGVTPDGGTGTGETAAGEADIRKTTGTVAAEPEQPLPGHRPPEYRLRLIALADTDGARATKNNDPGRAREWATLQPDDYTAELHLDRAPEEDLREALLQAVRDAGFRNPGFRVVERVGGFYDRQK